MARRRRRSAAAARCGSRSMANGQRGWNRQPAGGADQARRLAAPASSGAADVAGRSGSGAEPTSSRVYGCAGVLRDGLAVAALDHPAGVHHQRLVGEVAGRRDVVGDVEDGEVAAGPRRSRSRLRTPSRIDTSSIDTGSSASSASGSAPSARAIATRWRWPPDSSCGNLSRYRSAGRQLDPVRAARRGPPRARRRAGRPRWILQRAGQVCSARCAPGSATRTGPGRSSGPGARTRGTPCGPCAVASSPCSRMSPPVRV